MLPDGPDVAPQVTSRPPRRNDSSEPLQVSAPTCSNTTSTPLLGGELSHDALEAVLAVIDDVIGAEVASLRRFVVAADGGDDRAAERFRHADSDAADAGTAGMHQDPFARFQPRVVEQHVFDRGIGDSDAGGVVQIDRVGQLGGEARGVVGEGLREAIDMKAAHAGDVLAQVLAAARAEAAGATDQRGVRHDAIAGRELVTPSPIATTSHAASAPTVSGNCRLAKAMPRKPHTSIWFSPT